MEPTIAILAGGQATRLGGRKATAALAGRPMISYPLSAALESGLGVVVVAKPDTELPELEAPVLREPAEPRHPLCGIVAALRHSRDRPIVVLACDMPFAGSELLIWLASLPDRLAVPRSGGHLQPLIGRYDPSLLASLEALLGEDRPLQEIVGGLSPREIEYEELAAFGDPERLLMNVNTAADLERAEALLD